MGYKHTFDKLSYLFLRGVLEFVQDGIAYKTGIIFMILIALHLRISHQSLNHFFCFRNFFMRPATAFAVCTLVCALPCYTWSKFHANTSYCLSNDIDRGLGSV